MQHPIRFRASICLTSVLAVCAAAGAQTGFVNWESPHVSPIALTPSGSTLLAVNTADNRLEVFDVSGGTPVHLGSVAVGLDPVSVRARTETEAWVVNRISDNISIVDLPTGRVVRTINTGDEPADVVFAGTPQRAFVSVSQLNEVRVFNPFNPGQPPVIVPIKGEDPRALATNASGSTVYVAIFESGNGTTVVDRQAVSAPFGPYGGQNPPPNAGAVFDPPLNPALPAPPPVALIVRKGAAGGWMDDNGVDWSGLVNWDLHDHDVAMIDVGTLAVTYASGLMNLDMHLAVKPSGEVSVVGTEAINDVRFEPKVNGGFVRVVLGTFVPATPAASTLVDLNPHLTYAVPTIPPALRNQSIGDPRGIVWEAGGDGYITGMGSNNVIVVGSGGGRLGQINVGAGPTGLVMDEGRSRLYVLSKFSATISEIDTVTRTEVARVGFFDPTPAVIRAGRPHLYDTHRTSGLGQASCASCHVDGRMDQLAWDLGNPAGTMKTVNQTCRQGPGNCIDWHPMKGPMVTQSLLGIIGTEPFHWRGDKESLSAFNGAFMSLMGDDTQLTPLEMTQFTNFVATLRYPPNPNRDFDNALRPLLPNGGNAQAGLNLYLTAPITGGALTCVACHALPTGTDTTVDFLPAAPEPQTMKIAQLRNMHRKTGFSRLSANNNRGFGYTHDGSVDTLTAFLNLPPFNFPPGPLGVQQRRDMEAFLLSLSVDTHAGVGRQLTLNGANNNYPPNVGLINTAMAMADASEVGLVVKGRQGGLNRGWVYLTGGVFQSDHAGETITADLLRNSAAPGSELTYTLVPFGTEVRIGIDRDRDGALDLDEVLGCGDPANPAIRPTARGDVNGDGFRNMGDVPAFVAVLLDPIAAPAQPACTSDMNLDGSVNGADIEPFMACLVQGTCP